MADSGIRTVDYATGYFRRLESAVRQNILWGVKQCNQNTADMIGEDFGRDGYEISYHSNPRPSHADMGGKQYAIGGARWVNGKYYPSFEEKAEPLLNEFGCLHFKFSILLGISEPAYSKEQLAHFKAEDNKKIEFEGKEYTRYEASQLQKRIESEVRRQKDRANIAKASGDDIMRREAQYRINLLTNKYAKLSKESGLPTKMERIQMAGFKKVKIAENSLTEIKENGIIKEIKDIGIKGDVNLHPKKIDLSTYGFDEEHINGERKHNITRDDAERFVKTAKVSITTWKGRFEKYISEQGATYIDTQEKTIRTAFSSDEYDEKTKKILEVLRKYGR